jgi:hypothetical protein
MNKVLQMLLGLVITLLSIGIGLWLFETTTGVLSIATLLGTIVTSFVGAYMFCAGSEE